MSAYRENYTPPPARPIPPPSREVREDRAPGARRGPLVTMLIVAYCAAIGVLSVVAVLHGTPNARIAPLPAPAVDAKPLPSLGVVGSTCAPARQTTTASLD
jgi:hypothetical protein